MACHWTSRRTVAAWLLCGMALGSACARGAAAKHEVGQFLTAWRVCGPFAARGLLDEVVEDEGLICPGRNPEMRGKIWIPLRAAEGVVNLEGADRLGVVDHALAFAFAEIESDEEGEAILGVGSDDGVSVWWNGRLVLVNEVLRDMEPGEDQVRVRLAKGRNTILAKIYDEGGGWGFGMDLRSRDGKPWPFREVVPLGDRELLETIERQTFNFFWDEADPVTGLIRDSAPTAAGKNDAPCSVASVGFGLTAICIADEHGWVKRAEARERVARTLRFVLEHVEQEHGFLCHFVEPATGKRAWNSEISSIDTALFLAGALTCRNYFRDREITALANALYGRVDWPWMLNGEKTLCMGWQPGSGFGSARWDVYSEHMFMYLLGLGAPSNPLPAECWYAWKRPYHTYEGMTYVQAVPLFLHQYSHCWVDFRDKRDAFADYFKNSRLATRAHRQFCVALADRFPWYGKGLWGVTASKGPKGYMLWGGPPPTLEYPLDGSVVPCAAGGSVPFLPDLTVPVLRGLYEQHRDKAWGRYGFLDAYNPHTGWVADGYIGIDQGALLLMLENHLTGNVWKWFMDCPEMEKAMRASGFKDTRAELDKADLDYLREVARDTWECIAYFVHPETQMPYDSSRRGRHTSSTNIGLYLAALGAAREMGLVSAEEALRRAEVLISSVEKFPTWHGFSQCWHDAADLTPSADDAWVSVVDFGNMAMGLAAGAQAFPTLAERCRKLLDIVEWDVLYDAKAQQLYGGYDMKNQKLNPDWRVDSLATDSRGAAFMSVVSGKVPADVWNRLNRDMSGRYEVKYLKPGWVGGGLFMQYLTGIFLDEKDSMMGRSAANMAYANLRHADAIGSRVWGWSSSADPAGGYIGWGKLQDEVVTPHASVLTIEGFPREVLANLLELERLGARRPWEEGGASHAFGFRDSVNWKTGQVAEDYLVLDQGMLFLSLANFLEGGLIRKWFHADPAVTAAEAKIDELSRPEGGPDVSVFEPGLGAIVARPQVERAMTVPRLREPPKLDGDLSDWPETAGRTMVRFPDQSEFGVPPNTDRFDADVHVGWDGTFFYVGVHVREDELVCEAPAAELYKDDAIEMFIDPQNDGLKWGDRNDFQIGLSPSGPGGSAQIYAWFQNTVPPGAEVAAATAQEADGAAYTIEVAIPWSFLQVTDPGAGRALRFSLAVHTVSRDRASSAKINWSYLADIEQIRLGELTLAE